MRAMIVFSPGLGASQFRPAFLPLQVFPKCTSTAIYLPAYSSWPLPVENKNPISFYFARDSFFPPGSKCPPFLMPFPSPSLAHRDPFIFFSEFFQYCNTYRCCFLRYLSFQDNFRKVFGLPFSFDRRFSLSSRILSFVS